MEGILRFSSLENKTLPFGHKDNVKKRIIPSDLMFPQRAGQDLGSGSALAKNGSMTWFQLVGAAERKYLMEAPQLPLLNLLQFFQLDPSRLFLKFPSQPGDVCGVLLLEIVLGLGLGLCEILQSRQSWDCVCVRIYGEKGTLIPNLSLGLLLVWAGPHLRLLVKVGEIGSFLNNKYGIF